MPIAFKKDDLVEQIVTPIKGKVIDIAVIDADIQFCVEYKTVDGETHQRFFTEAEIKAGI